jgi:chromosome partitioning protein
MTIVVVGAEKGGVGKTGIAANLAAIAASDGVEVILLDTDTTGSATAWSRIRTEEAVEPGVIVLTVPEKPLQELTKLSSKFDLIIVDIGAQNYRTMLQAAVLADILLVPTGPDQFELESTQAVFETLRQMSSRHPKGQFPAYAVLNKCSTNPRSKEADLLGAFLTECEIPQMDSRLGYRAAWRSVNRTGRALHELKGKEFDARAAEQMRALYDEIVTKTTE